MTEFWVSKAKFWCKYCKCWMSDNKASRAKHDNGPSPPRPPPCFSPQFPRVKACGGGSAPNGGESQAIGTRRRCSYG